MSDSLSTASLMKATSFPPLVREPPPPPGMRASFGFGFSLAAAQLKRRRTALTLLLAFALALASAWIEKRFAAMGAVDRALESAFRILIPLLTFAVFSETTGRSNLRDAAWPVARFGAERRGAVCGMLAGAALVAVLSSAALAAVSVIAAHTPSAPPLLSDAALSARIAAAAAFSYTGYYALGATFFRFGRGRFIPLIVDFLMGGSAGLAGVIMPRGNAINLLGGAPPMGLSQSASFVILFVSGGLAAALALLRCRR